MQHDSSSSQFVLFRSHTHSLCMSSSLILSYSISRPLSSVDFPLQPPISVCLRNTHMHTIPHTMRAWLISVSLPCFRKVSEQGRPFERHFNPNYVDLKTALDTYGSRRWEGEGGGGGVGLSSWIFMNRHFKHILSWVTAGGEPANQLLLRRSLSATALQVSQVSLCRWHQCWNSGAKAFKCGWTKRISKYFCYITVKSLFITLKLTKGPVSLRKPLLSFAAKMYAELKNTH